MPLQGTFTALITPFSEDKNDIDWVAFEKIIKHQVNSGITGLVPCGTTGESPTLTHDEHKEFISRTVQLAKQENSDTIIIAGTGSNSTREAIALTQSAANDGADFALVVNPYYNKPTQDGLYQHFIAIAEASKIPLVLYNIPGRTSVTLSLETIIKLSQHDNIKAIKEATGDLNLMAQIISNTDEKFSLLSGDDNLSLPVLSLGGKGTISVISNLFPAEISLITKHYLSGNIEQAREIFYKYFELCQAMFYETNPIPVKYAAARLGFSNGKVRLPLTTLDKKYHDKLNNLLEAIG